MSRPPRAVALAPSDASQDHPSFRGALPPAALVAVDLEMPSILTSIVNQLDPREASVARVTLRPSSGRSRVVRVTAIVHGYSAPRVETVTLDRHAREVRLLPTFFEDRLRSSEVTTATLEIDVHDVEARRSIATSFSVRLLARTTGFFAPSQPCADDDPFDPSWLAAFVTPNAVEVLAVVREVVELHPDGKLEGPRSPSLSAARRRELGAVDVETAFRTLAARALVYASQRRIYGASGDGYQRVRLPRETLATRLGNCVDRTVLFASVLEAMGVSVGLAFVRGHTFLAWELPHDLAASEAPPQPNGRPGARRLWDYVDPTLLDLPFEDAVKRARWNVSRALANGDPKLAVVSVEELRARGIAPME